LTEKKRRKNNFRNRLKLSEMHSPTIPYITKLYLQFVTWFNCTVISMLH